MKFLDYMKKYKRIFGVFLALLLFLGIIQFQISTHQLDRSEKPEMTQNVEPDRIYESFLLLGSDKGAEKTNGGDHTDSITYVAYSPTLNKVYAIPIYRDVIVSLVCGGEKNINHVYRDHGADCLVQSVENLLDLPVDYYVYTTSDAFVRIGDQIGGVVVPSNETFCSEYSNNGQTYCVEAGKEYTMNGNMLLAYARDRNHGSGVPRANRHQAIVSGFAKGCLQQLSACSVGVQQEVEKGNVAHNLPIATILQIQASSIKPTTTFEFIPLDALKGSNYADAQGVWHMKPDAQDIAAKKAIIQTAFGERKKESA